MTRDSSKDEAANKGGATCKDSPDKTPETAMLVAKRIHEKSVDYRQYGFSAEQSQALNIFFDLAQEFEGSDDFFSITVSIPKLLFDLDSSLYLITECGNLHLVRTTQAVAEHMPPDIGEGRFTPTKPFWENDRLYFPLKANQQLIEQLPYYLPNGIIGLFEISSAGKLSDHEKLFWEKYANRVGFQLHIRTIKTKNLEHLEFINNLVADIGHNVIVPNMYFKLFFNRLRGKIDGLGQLSEELKAYASDRHDLNESNEKLWQKVDYFHDGLMTQFNEIFRHYEQTSLFLETLLRRSHFEEGHYVLEKRSCDITTQVIEPQLERFTPRFEEKGIEIDMTMGAFGEHGLKVEADVGLLSQVYANFFSNAIKYTRPVNLDGTERKYLAYGYEILPNFFDRRGDGIKLNVFTSGPTLSDEDRERLFQSGFRASNVQDEYGTGHGLFFIKQVIELHGGQVGCEPGRGGNNFYFILPMPLSLHEHRHG